MSKKAEYPRRFEYALIDVIDQWWVHSYDGAFIPPSIMTIIMFMDNIYDAKFDVNSGEWTFTHQLEKPEAMKYTR